MRRSVLSLLCIFGVLSCNSSSVEMVREPGFKEYIQQVSFLNDYPILSESMVHEESLMFFFIQYRKDLDPGYLNYIINLYMLESRAEGVSSIVAFSQMCHETEFLKFTGAVSADQNNFAGIGTVNQVTPGDSFPTIQRGIRAQIQHLKGYASKAELGSELVDPRFHLISRGTVTTVQALTGAWAVDPEYGKKLMKYIREIVPINNALDISQKVRAEIENYKKAIPE
jgi:hypothetical protein